MKLGELIVEIGADTAKFAEGLDFADVKLKGLSQRARDSAANVAKYTAAAVAAGAATATYLVKRSIDANRELSNLADLANTSAEELQKFGFAAQSVGGDMDLAASTLLDFQDKLGDFLTTGAGPMVDWFDTVGKKAGITAAQLKNMSGQDGLVAFVDAMQKANLTQAEMRFHMEGISGDASRLLPLLRDGGQALREQAERAEKLGIVLDDIEVEKLNQAGRALEETSATIDGMIDKIAAEFAPVILKIGDDFLESIAGVNGFGSAVDNAFEHAVNAAGFVIDAIDGIKRTFSLAADIVIASWATVAGFIADKIADVLELISKIPFGIGDNVKGAAKTVREFAEGTEGVVRQAVDNMHDTLMKPPPSDGFKEYIHEIKEEAEAAAAAVVAAKEATRTEGQTEETPTGAAALTAEQAKQRMEILRSLADSEEELRTAQFASEIEQVNAFYQGKVGLEDEWREVLKEKAQQFEEDLYAIRARGVTSVESLLKTHYGWQVSEAYSTGREALSAFASHSKKAFELNKKVSLAETVISGYHAAVDAWKAGMSTGGPWAPAVAASYTAASLAKTGGIIQQIRGMQYGSSGGGGASTAGGSGVAGATGAGAGGGQSNNFTAQIERTGDGGLSEGSLVGIVDMLNERIRDGQILQGIEII